MPASPSSSCGTLLMLAARRTRPGSAAAASGAGVQSPPPPPDSWSAHARWHAGLQNSIVSRRCVRPPGERRPCMAPRQAAQMGWGRPQAGAAQLFCAPRDGAACASSTSPSCTVPSAAGPQLPSWTRSALLLRTTAAELLVLSRRKSSTRAGCWWWCWDAPRARLLPPASGPAGSADAGPGGGRLAGVSGLCAAGCCWSPPGSGLPYDMFTVLVTVMPPPPRPAPAAPACCSTPVVRPLRVAPSCSARLPPARLPPARLPPARLPPAWPLRAWPLRAWPPP